MLFRDRGDAGQRLATAMAGLAGQVDLVLAIPRGGVIVAAAIAQALKAPLDVWLTHKIGAPDNEELAIGAISAAGQVYLDDEMIAYLHVKPAYLSQAIARQKAELQRRLSQYRGRRSPPEITNRTVVLVDDGVATGATTLLGLRTLRQQRPARLILAVPVGPVEAITRLRQEADQVFCLATPEPFWAVGRFFTNWNPVSDQEVIAALTASQPDHKPQSIPDANHSPTD